MFSSLRLALARIGRWPRLAAAGVCLLLAAASALESRHHPAAPAAPGVDVVVAAHDLAAGHTLVRADLTVGRWPPALAPPGARSDPAALLGMTLAGPIDRREAVTPTRLVGPGLTAGLPAGILASVITIDQDVGSFVRVGDLVAVLAAPRDDLSATDGSSAGSHAAVVAAHVRVLAATRVSTSDATGQIPGVRLVIAVDRTEALRIAELRSVSTLTVVTESS